MKKIILLFFVAVLFTGCHWFKYYDQRNECYDLLERAEYQLVVGYEIVDSLVTENQRLKDELFNCKINRAEDLGYNRIPGYPKAYIIIGDSIVQVDPFINPARQAPKTKGW